MASLFELVAEHGLDKRYTKDRWEKEIEKSAFVYFKKGEPYYKRGPKDALLCTKYREAVDWHLDTRPNTELKLGPEHLGKGVKHRNGSLSIIVEYTGDAAYPIRTPIDRFTLSGYAHSSEEEDPRDIVEVLNDRQD